MNQSVKQKTLLGFLACLLLLALDQITKRLAVVYLAGHNDISIIPNVLHLHYLENTGAAFSLLENKMLFFYIITIVLCILMVYLYIRLPQDQKFIPLQIILIFLFSGAVGNLIDRIMNQYVIDFIYFKLINFPVFNVADIYVTCSVFVLFYLVIFKYKEDDINMVFDSFKRKK